MEALSHRIIPLASRKSPDTRSTITMKPAKDTSTILELFPTEIFLNIVHNLDSYSIRDLLRAFHCLSNRAIVVLGPENVKGSDPSFFTGFPSAICQCSSDPEQYRLYPVKLYEVNTRVSPLLSGFINSELKHLMGMSFIHFKGNLNPLGDTRVMKTLNSMHTPYAPRISFEYCARKSKFNVQKKYICFPSVLNTDYFSKEYTNISIDSRYLTEIGDIKFKHIKQLEIRFYKSESIPVIRDLDLPNVGVFSIKYYRKIPLIKNIKIGYGNTELGVKRPQKRRTYFLWYEPTLNIGPEFKRSGESTHNTIFELFDTSGFDVHYKFNGDRSTNLSDYEGHMDWGFTGNFNTFFIVGGSMIVLFTMFNLKNATTFFWYDSIFHVNHWEQFPESTRDQFWYDEQYCGAPQVKSFTYITSNAFGTYPRQIKLSEHLEVVRMYTNNHQLSVNGPIWYTLHDGRDEWEVDYSNRLTIVDICCDLPYWAVGTEAHIVIANCVLLQILYSPGMRYVNLSGCYLGEDNDALFKEYPQFPSEVFTCEPVPYKKEFKIELVRPLKSDDADVLVLNMSSLRNYLNSLTITQAVGAEDHKGWTGLTAIWPDHLLTEGLQVHIDASFGTPTVSIRTISSFDPYTLTVEPISSHDAIHNEISLNRWTAVCVGSWEAFEDPIEPVQWTMVPIAEIEADIFDL